MSATSSKKKEKDKNDNPSYEPNFYIPDHSSDTLIWSAMLILWYGFTSIHLVVQWLTGDSLLPLTIQDVPSACTRFPPCFSGLLLSKRPILSSPKNPPEKICCPWGSLRFTHLLIVGISQIEKMFTPWADLLEWRLMIVYMNKFKKLKCSSNIKLEHKSAASFNSLYKFPKKKGALYLLHSLPKNYLPGKIEHQFMKAPLQKIKITISCRACHLVHSPTSPGMHRLQIKVSFKYWQILHMIIF